jgi:hypothetical protein
MRKTLFAAAFLCLFSITLSAQEKSADTMVHKVYRALKSKNETAFISLFPNYEQMKRFLRQSVEAELKQTKDPSAAKMSVDSLMEMMMGQMTEEAFNTQMKNEFAHSFHSILEAGEAKGINWNNTVLTHYTLDSLVEESFPSMKGVMDLKDGEKEYQLAFNQIVWLDKEGGWFGISLRNIVHKGESLEDAADEELPPPPPPPAKNYPGKKEIPAKKPVAKPKTTPAQKPKTTPLKTKG